MNAAKTSIALSIAALGFLAGRATSTTPAQDTEATLQEAAMSMPGPMHRALDPLVGTFNVELKFWVPGVPEAMTMTGESVQEWILGGHYLQQKFTGEMMGMPAPFEGVGITGYGDVREGYSSIWIDNMSNDMYTTQGGTISEDKKTLTTTGEMVDGMTQQVVKVKDVIQIEDENKHTMVQYRIGDDGSETKAMEIVYTRK